MKTRKILYRKNPGLRDFVNFITQSYYKSKAIFNYFKFVIFNDIVFIPNVLSTFLLLSSKMKIGIIYLENNLYKRSTKISLYKE